MNKFIWLVIVGVIGLVFVFFAGIGVGISATTETKPAEFVASVFGSAGDWVSGLGALAAAVIAVNLADRQRKDSFPRITISQLADPYGFHFDIISVGDRSALVTRVFLRSRKFRRQARLGPHDQFPKRLEFGDVYGITVEANQFRKISNLLCGHDEEEDFSDMEIVVETSMKAHVFPADSSIIGLIEGNLSISHSYEG